MEEKEKIQPKKEKQPRPFLRFTGMAAQMGITIFVGVFGGIKLDEYLQLKTPIFTLVFSLLSVGISIYLVIKDLSK